MTNRPEVLCGVDNRSTFVRRRRDLIRTYTDALGGAEKVSATVMNDVVRAVDLVLIAEKARSQALCGEKLDLDVLTRLESTADRAVRRLGIKPGSNAPKPMTITQYTAQKVAEKAARVPDGDAA